MDKKILIIGAGPCGLGAAYRLAELGYKNWKIVEKNSYVGGLAASFRDDSGFTWDIGGHVLFSSHAYFSQLVSKVLGNDYIEHNRKAYIRLFDSWVEYPFQNNIQSLPFNKALNCFCGMLFSRLSKKTPGNFKEWALFNFGDGIANYFMLPYNSKVWSYPLEGMSYDWVGERISPVSLSGALRNLILGRKDNQWGENSKFKFPLNGGTGEIFRRIVPFLEDRLLINREVVSVDTKKRSVEFKDSAFENYDIIINTMPLDIFVRKAGLNILHKEIEKLKHNSVFVVGLGIKGPGLGDKNWVYFPEKKYPFYRLTYFSNYSPYNTPGEGYSSLLCEVSVYGNFNKYGETLVGQVIDSLSNNGLLRIDAKKHIVSKFFKLAEYAYPIPTLGRDGALTRIQPYLESLDIYSRGRFGAWIYEKANMDHSFMQGVEVVDKILADSIR